jgi:hypothetical protein
MRPLAPEESGPLGRTPLRLLSVLPGATQWSGGRAPDNRHDLFIGLSEPRQTQPAGFKRALNLPELRVTTFSTAHDHLLVPEEWEGQDACRVGAGRRESPHHSWDIAVCVEYSSRTLTEGSQLCKECSGSPLGCPRPGGSEDSALHDPGFEPTLDESSQSRKRVELGEQIGVIDPVEALF